MSRLPHETKPTWLTELQQKSWEPEILLSGIVLYGLFKAPGLLDQLMEFVDLNLYGSSFTDLDNLVALVKIALYWLTFGLILHLISRGIWVGMVGLSFTFPGGIDKDKLKVSPKFSNNLDRIPTMEKIILNLEKVCSSLFALSFMMFMMIVGSYFFFLVTLFIPIVGVVFSLGIENTTEPIIAGLKIYSYVILFIGFVGLIDFLTLGLLKRLNWFSKVYYPVYQIISALTLARFYRPIYYTLISNFSRWKIAAFLVAFVVINLYIMNSYSNSNVPGESWSRLEFWNGQFGTSAFSGYYDDQNGDFHSVQAHIQSDIISENTIRLFTVLGIGREDSIRKFCNYDSLIALDTARKYIQIHCVSSFYQVLLDGEKVENLTWKFHFKQKTNQRGILSYIDITDLPAGNHMLEVKGPDEMYKYNYAQIPFYRELSNDGYYLNPAKSKSKEEEYLQLKSILPK